MKTKLLPEIIILVIITIGGAFYIFKTWNGIQEKRQKEVLVIAKSIEALLPQDLLHELDYDINDTIKPEYKKLKSLLEQALSVNQKARFIYIYSIEGDKIIFLVDAEPHNSSDWSPPGQIYTEADEYCKKAINESISLVSPSTSDRWGNWISAYVPIMDESGKTVAALGMDFNSKAWNRDIFLELTKSVFLVILFLVTLLFLVRIRSKNRMLKSEIDDRINKQNQIKDNEIKYRRIANKMTDVVWLMDLQGNSLFVSPSIKQFTGYTEEEYLNQKILERFTPESAQYGLGILENEVKRYLSKPEENHDQTKVLEMEYICKDGSTKWGELIVSPYLDDNNNLIGIHGVTRDVTDRRKTNEELIKAKEKAEESDRLKSAFLSNMSHEIRTPMNGILGFASLLQRPNLTGEKQKEYIKLIEKSGVRMLNIINDIVDISKIESGQMSLYSDEVNLNELMENLFSFFKPETDAKNIKFSFSSGLENTNSIVVTDKEKLYAILTNLIKNAVKFTSLGNIHFGYKVSNAKLLFFVSDTGKGISPEQKEFIFDRFRQGSESHSKDYQGAGLGLSITKAYVEMMDGSIWVDSTIDKGSDFNFTIPLIKSETNADIDDSLLLNNNDIQKTGLKVLIAEDNEESIMFLNLILDNLVKEIKIAVSGKEALDLYRKYKPDIILMDIQMPEICGYEVTKQIRETDKDVIIIAQTAYAFAEDREKAILAGCNDFIAKPYSDTEIIDLIRKYS
ncbi:MAG: response regulator [Bacteroidales bacterium]|nr:response regulator [Bacteroidales bacterium]